MLEVVENVAAAVGVAGKLEVRFWQRSKVPRTTEDGLVAAV